MTILVSSIMLSQTQDLYALAKGEYLGFNAIFDQKDNLFGYVSLYRREKEASRQKSSNM